MMDQRNQEKHEKLLEDFDERRETVGRSTTSSRGLSLYGPGPGPSNDEFRQPANTNGTETRNNERGSAGPLEPLVTFLRQYSRQQYFEAAVVLANVLGFIAILLLAAHHTTAHMESTELTAIKTNTEKLNSDLDYFKKVIKTVSGVIETECGGIITLPQVQSSMVLEYKSLREKGSNRDEHCLWMFDNTANSVRRKLTIKIKVFTEGPQGYKTQSGGELYALKWSRDVELRTEKLLTKTVHEFTEDALFLSFFSSKTEVDSGFTVQITVVRAVGNGFGTNSYSATAPGRSGTSLGYHNNDLVTLIVNPGKSTALTIESLNSEANHDRLYVFEVKPMGHFENRAKLSGSHSRTTVLTTTQPILTIFTTDTSQTSSGFTVSWT